MANFTSPNISLSMYELSSSYSGGAPSKSTYMAQVLEVSGGKATLSIDGKTVVADAEVQLSAGSEIELTVRGYDSTGRVQLQVTGTYESSDTPVQTLTNDMISSRLEGFDLPDHTATIESARALIREGVAVTKANMETMLSALPKTADAATIEFAAAVLKEELPLTRELIQSLPAIAENIEALPDNMKAAGEAVIRALQQIQNTQQTESFVQVNAGTDSETIQTLQTLLPPASDNAGEIADQIPNFVRGFLHSTEARLQALTESGLAQTPGAEARAAFTDSLVNILKLIPETPPQDASIIERAINSLVNQTNNIMFAEADKAAFGQLRTELENAVSQAMQLENTSSRFDAIRNSVELILAKAIDLQVASPAESEAPSYPSIFSQSLNSLPENLDKAVSEFTKLLQQLQTAQQQDAKGTQAQQAATTQDSATQARQVATAAERLAPLLNFKFDSEATPAIKEFADAAAALTKEALNAVADSKENGISRSMASNPDAAVAMERLKAAIDNPALKREIEFLGRNFNNLPDVRAAIARSETSQDLPTAMLRSLAQGIQSANIANVVRHTGAAQLDSLVTFFPIQVGDHVEIGKLKIFRREEDISKDRKSVKPLNPFNAHLVLILDTEFLGLTQISFNTFPDKSIKCKIEVGDNRRKKITEKYLDELRDALESTAYEKNSVSVSIRRRKQEGTESEQQEAHQASAVDFRI